MKDYVMSLFQFHCFCLFAAFWKSFPSSCAPSNQWHNRSTSSELYIPSLTQGQGLTVHSHPGSEPHHSLTPRVRASPFTHTQGQSLTIHSHPGSEPHHSLTSVVSPLLSIARDTSPEGGSPLGPEQLPDLCSQPAEVLLSHRTNPCMADCHTAITVRKGRP